MPIHPDALSSLASGYAKGMTSIRARRVQRLLKREFAGAEHVLVVQVGSGTSAVLGLSARGAAFCATNGRGKQASVVKWLHGSGQALEVSYDLLKDSLPVLSTDSLALPGLAEETHWCISAGSVPPEARPLVATAIQALFSSESGVRSNAGVLRECRLRIAGSPSHALRGTAPVPSVRQASGQCHPAPPRAAGRTKPTVEPHPAK